MKVRKFCKRIYNANEKLHIAVILPFKVMYLEKFN